MLAFSKLLRTNSLAVFVLFIFLVGAKIAPSQVSQRAQMSNARPPISVVIWTDQAKYRLTDSVKLNASLQNTGDEPLYVDRRMFWGGYGGGLRVVISDEQGKPVPAPILNDAIMPPPKEGDTSILIRLDEGFFYGTWVNLPVKDFFSKPGRYSIRVIYKSWLRKEFVASQLRDLPALWAETPEIPSEQVWMQVAP
jgi:hypothetical protein